MKGAGGKGAEEAHPQTAGRIVRLVSPSRGSPPVPFFSARKNGNLCVLDVVNRLFL